MKNHAGRFQVRGLQDGSSLSYPKVYNLHLRTKLSVSASSLLPTEIAVHRGDPSGALLAKLIFNPTPGETTALKRVRDTDALCLVFRGGPGELIRLNRLIFT